MLEDCSCSVHRYLFTIISHPPDSIPRVAGDSDSGDSDSDSLCCRCQQRVFGGGPSSPRPWPASTSQRCSTPTRFLFSHPPATTLMYMCKGLSSVRSYGPSAIDHGPSDQHQDLTRVDSLIQYESFMPISSPSLFSPLSPDWETKPLPLTHSVSALE